MPVELDITPEPTEAERLSIEAALHALERDAPSLWWQDGLRENLELEPWDAL